MPKASPAMHTSTAVSHPTPARRAPASNSAAEAPDPRELGSYFRGMSAVDVMSREEELAAAVRIADLRRGFWRALLGHAPFVAQICAFARELLPTETCPEEALAAALASDGCPVAHDALADELGLADLDGVVSDRILVALASGELAGQEAGVARYRTAVRANHAALVAAKNAFVKANLRLVVMIARRFDRGTMPLPDLIQEGNIGLIKAVDRFDHRKGFRFSTYGSWWIRHAINRGLADKGREIRLPVHVLEAHHKLSRASREFESLHGRKPQLDELAEHTSIASEKIERMSALSFDRAISLDRPISDEDGRGMVDFLKDDEAPAPGEHLEVEALSEQVRSVITQLRPIEADILRKRFGLDGSGDELTLKEIGTQYSLSRERIRQLQDQALDKIRRELKRRAVE